MSLDEKVVLEYIMGILNWIGKYRTKGDKYLS